MKRYKHQKQRGRYIEVRLRLPSGEWKWTKTDCVKGQEAEADHVRQEAQAKIDAGEPVVMELGPLTVERYANEVFLPWCRNNVDGRVRIRDWPNYGGILQRWVLPQIGPLSLEKVRRKDILGVVNSVRSTNSARGTPVSSRRVLNIYGVMQSLFRNAMVDELITRNPCTLTRDPRGCGDLPVVEDADPEWRATAKYSKAEVAQLLTNSRIPADRRMLYGLEFFGRCRHGEAAGLKWRCWLRDRGPLSCLLLTTSYNNGRTKTGTVREMPVHKVLEEMLGWWWSGGWQQVMGRAPTPDDLIVPAPPEEQVRRLSRRTELRIADLSYDRLLEDLGALGLRQRRGHDLGRSFISLAREDGARKDILKHCTHGKPRDIIEEYSTLSWETYCTEVSKLTLDLPPGGEPSESAGEGKDASPDGPWDSPWDKAGPGPTIPGGKIASPTGFEPVSPA